MKKFILILITLFAFSAFAGEITVLKRFKCTSDYTCLCYYNQAYMCPFGWQYKANQECSSFEGEDEQKAEEYINENLTCHFNYYIGETKTICTLLAT